MRNARPHAQGRRAGAFRLLLAALVLLLGAVTPRSASAAGTLTVANLSPTENDGKWKLQMTLNYGSVPHIGHVPMLFVFTPTVLYERTLTDQSPERPIINRMPLQNQQSINESMDVGFSDASGKVFAITKFDFVIRRDRGFEAGEYKLEVKRAGDGVRVGNVMTLKLQGDNPIVDRRAMVFAGGGKKKDKPAEGEGEKKAEGEGEKKAEGEGEAAAASEPPPGDPAAEGSEPPADGAEPPPVAPKQGGCGCRVASPDGGAAGLALLGFGAVLLVARGRRRGAARAAADSGTK